MRKTGRSTAVPSSIKSQRIGRRFSQGKVEKRQRVGCVSRDVLKSPTATGRILYPEESSSLRPRRRSPPVAAVYHRHSHVTSRETCNTWSLSRVVISGGRQSSRVGGSHSLVLVSLETVRERAVCISWIYIVYIPGNPLRDKTVDEFFPRTCPR